MPPKEFEGPATLRSAWRYAEIFFRRASNVGFVDAAIADGRYRGVPFVAIAPPATLRCGSLLRWMLPTVDAVRHLVESGCAAATGALERWHPAAVQRSTDRRTGGVDSLTDTPPTDSATSCPRRAARPAGGNSVPVFSASRAPR